MATSNSATFNMEFTDIAEEAFERAGREMRSGYDLKTARRSMNLLTIEWQNRGINMWTIDSGTIDLVQGQTQYPLPADTIDLLEHQVRTGSGNVATQSDLNLSRISVSTYASIPKQSPQNRISQISPSDFTNFALGFHKSKSSTFVLTVCSLVRNFEMPKSPTFI